MQCSRSYSIIHKGPSCMLNNLRIATGSTALKEVRRQALKLSDLFGFSMFRMCRSPRPLSRGNTISVYPMSIFEFLISLLYRLSSNDSYHVPSTRVSLHCKKGSFGLFDLLLALLSEDLRQFAWREDWPTPISSFFGNDRIIFLKSGGRHPPCTLSSTTIRIMVVRTIRDECFRQLNFGPLRCLQWRLFTKA